MHELLISAEVIRELSDPRFSESADALGWVRGLPLLALTEDVLGLAALLVRERVLPAPVLGGDAVHVAVATVHAIPFGRPPMTEPDHPQMSEELIEEIRAIPKAIWEEDNSDFRQHAERLREIEVRHAGVMIQPPSRQSQEVSSH